VGAEVRFTVLTGDGRIENGVAVSGQDGIAESGSWTLGPAAGIQQVKVESGRAQMIFLAHAYVPPSGLQGKLAFVSASDGNADIYVADADGLRRLTTNSSAEVDPAWSPDGSQIAFVVGETHIDYPLLLLGGSIYVMAADGSNVMQRTRGPRDRDPAWHPGGSAIAFSAFDNRSTQIATVDKAGETVFLTDDAGQEFEPSWSPDGRRLAFVTDWQFYDFVHDIHTMNADGTLQTRQTDSWALWPTLLLDYLHPVWSPDGSKIAFVYGRLTDGGDLLSSVVVFTVAVMSADGVFIKDLASAGGIPYREVLDPGSLTWSPDGRGIAYTSVGGCEPSSEICRRMHSVNYVSLDGSQQFRIVSNAHSPSWHR
jgi:Tol biopolymer transport system component